jgi:hypothetical protein
MLRGADGHLRRIEAESSIGSEMAKRYLRSDQIDPIAKNVVLHEKLTRAGRDGVRRSRGADAPSRGTFTQRISCVGLPVAAVPVRR